MATTRLRKAFRYPDDSEEEPAEGIDEEEQEKLIAQLQTEDVARTDFYKLTVFTDKLVAIQGLVNEIEHSLKLLSHSHKADGVDYGIEEDTCCYGVWSANASRQLLWHSIGTALTRPEALCNIDIPSWSWASVHGPIWLASELPRFGERWIIAYKSLTIEVSGKVELIGPCEEVLEGLMGANEEKIRKASSNERWPLVALDGRVIAHARTDNGERPVDPLCIVPLRKETKSGWVDSLLLEPSEKFGHYRRTGIAWGRIGNQL
ncbi:hypothetical protein SLS55_001987 [Diplodia seriata]|uniref:Uncharacterized protein n=1 Tax=Diplodia seriata TaxID=420778 RepID=A0ABR3CQX4_9PEZI